jgi:hypothetical protein
VTNDVFEVLRRLRFDEHREYFGMGYADFALQPDGEAFDLRGPQLVGELQAQRHQHLVGRELGGDDSVDLPRRIFRRRYCESNSRAAGQPVR